jgi:hypothetical protein
MVQSAQAAVCDGVKIFQSFNSDLLGQNYRSDGAGHFNDLGAATVALGVVTRIQASRPLFWTDRLDPGKRCCRALSPSDALRRDAVMPASASRSDQHAATAFKFRGAFACRPMPVSFQEPLAAFEFVGTGRFGGHSRDPLAWNDVVAHSAPIHEFESSQWSSLVLPIAAAIIWATSPYCPICREGWPQAAGLAIIGCYPVHRCSLPAQFQMKSVETVARDGLGLVPATPAMVGNVRAQRFAVPTGGGERTVPSVRLALERFCDDRW